MLRPENRGFVAALEAIGGDAIEGICEGAAEQPGFAPRGDPGRSAAGSDPGAAAPASDPVLPSPLRSYLGQGLDRVRWRWLLPGLREYRLAEPGVSLLWAKAGAKMPTHTHRGVEVTLVLKGAFGDATGRYARGDIEIGDEDLDHQPLVEKGEDCICFVVAEGALRLTGRFGRLIDKFQSH